MSKRLCISLLLLSLLLSGLSSSGHSFSAGSSQAKNHTEPQLALNVADWWNAPVEIKSVKLGEKEVSPGSAIAATDDWARYLSIEAVNKSEKTVSYIAYAIDFKFAGEEKLYRIRLQDGNYYASPGALTAAGGLRVAKGQQHNMRFSDDSWKCQSGLVGKINERKTRIVNVALFVESVGYTDDTLWSFGSHLKRKKGTSLFENVDYRRLSKGNTGPSTKLAKGFLAKGSSASSAPLSGCCIAFMDYMSGSASPVTVVVACSSCPPQAGGGSCPSPAPSKEQNSLTGQGSFGIAMSGFTHC